MNISHMGLCMMMMMIWMYHKDPSLTWLISFLSAHFFIYHSMFTFPSQEPGSMYEPVVSVNEHWTTTKVPRLPETLGKRQGGFRVWKMISQNATITKWLQVLKHHPWSLASLHRTIIRCITLSWTGLRNTQSASFYRVLDTRYTKSCTRLIKNFIYGVESATFLHLILFNSPSNLSIRILHLNCAFRL